MDEATLRQQQEALEREMVELSGLATKLQRELSEEERKLVGEIYQKMDVVIRQIAEHPVEFLPAVVLTFGSERGAFRR